MVTPRFVPASRQEHLEATWLVARLVTKGMLPLLPGDQLMQFRPLLSPELAQRDATWHMALFALLVRVGGQHRFLGSLGPSRGTLAPTHVDYVVDLLTEDFMAVPVPGQYSSTQTPSHPSDGSRVFGFDVPTPNFIPVRSASSHLPQPPYPGKADFTPAGGIFSLVSCHDATI